MTDGPIRFMLNGVWVEARDSASNTTLLNYLREARSLTGTKEGCAEGDCGACTVAVVDPVSQSYRAVNSCLMLLPMLHGKQVVTVEGLKQKGTYHPVQEAMVEELGSQCGYCTPGVVMSMFAACYRKDLKEPWQLDDQMCGNLCRCTGYRPIRSALDTVAGTRPDDVFAQAAQTPIDSNELAYEHGGERFLAPRTFDALWQAIDDNPEHRFVCGATDLGLDVTKRHARYKCLISVEEISALRQIQQHDTGWRIGAAVPLAQLEAEADTVFPIISRMLRFFGARQIKNRATLGGNLCNASPIGDMPPVLLALNATVVAASKQGERHIPIDAFFVDYRKTALKPGEILAAVDVPYLSEGTRAASFKVSKRRELDISAVSAGCLVELGSDGEITTARFAYGGMAATPSRASAVERALIGKPFNEATFEAAADCIDQDFTPIDDHRGSAWYRQTLAKNFVRGFFLECQDTESARLPDRAVGTVIV